MAAAIKWEAAPTARTAIDLGTTLATDVLSGVGAEIDNSTNLDTYGWLELTTSTGDLFSSPVTRVGASAKIYMVTALDGTNYSNTPVTGDVDEFGNLIISILIPEEAAVVPVWAGPIALPPCKFKLLLFNNTDQTLAATWELNLYTDNLESQ